MFKTMTFIALAIFSIQAFAEIELQGKFLREECTIKNGVATKVQVFGKDKDMFLTTTKKVSIEGIEKYVHRAIAQIRGDRDVNAESSFKIIIDGKPYEINHSDSDESLYVIRLIVKACN